MNSRTPAMVPVALAGLIDRVEGHAGGDVVVDLVGLIPLRLVVGPLEGRLSVRVHRVQESEDRAWDVLAAEEDGGSAELGAEPVETQIRIGLAQLPGFPRLSQAERAMAHAIAMVARNEKHTLDDVPPAALAERSGVTERAAKRIRDVLRARQSFVEPFGLAQHRGAGLRPAGVEDARATLREHLRIGRWAPHVLLPAAGVLAARYGLPPEAVEELLEESARAGYLAITGQGGVRKRNAMAAGNVSAEVRLAAMWALGRAPELAERVVRVDALGGRALAFVLEAPAAPVTVTAHGLGLARGAAIWADAGTPVTQRLAFHANLPAADLTSPPSFPTLRAMVAAVAAVAGG